MSKLALLKGATSLSDVAVLVGFSPSALSFILYKQPDIFKYQKFQIPKKTGGLRDISAPIGAMAALQTELAKFLYDCRSELEIANPRKPLSHAYRRGLSIITNAQPHTARRFVLNVDLANFFPTFNFGRVRGFFIKDNGFALDERVATVLAQIACFENSLPQGSACSPIIADMMGHLLDVRLVSLAKKARVTYSRYADDLTFSTNQKTFPEQLARADPALNGQWLVGDSLNAEILSAGFAVNLSKTRMQVRGSRQVVTGLTVNDKVNISQSYWRGIRSMCKSLYDKGEYYLPLTKAELAAGKTPVTINGLNTLAGMLSHAYYVKSESGRHPKAGDSLVVFGHTDHTRFWFFKMFVALNRPLIICEGSTDNIYLRNAMRQLAPLFPGLATKTPDGYMFGVSFFSYENLVHKILRLTGGISQILKFIHSYRESLKPYKYMPLQHAVIIVVDNDTALSAKVCGPLKKQFGVDITHASLEPFFHLTENLYLVKTPLMPGKAMTCIEDLFDSSTLSMPLDGKTFHAGEKDFEAAKHIGKVPFATKVIAPNADKIPWSGFSLLLERISLAINEHAAKIAASAAAAKIP